MNRQVVLALLAGIAASTFCAGAVSGQKIRGRIVDDATRQAMPGVEVRLLGSDSTVVARTRSARDGFFSIDADSGTWTIEIEQAGFVANRRTVEVSEGEVIVSAFVLIAQPIALDPVDVEVESRPPADRADVGFARASHTVAGERLAVLEGHGVRFPSAMRDLGAGLRVREWVDRDGTPRLCIESNRRLQTFRNPGGTGGCDWVAVVIDGIVIGSPEATARTLNLQMFESIEFFTPVEAGSRFGLQASGSGALVLWTRGRGPHVSEARNRR